MTAHCPIPLIRPSWWNICSGKEKSRKRGSSGAVNAVHEFVDDDLVKDNVVECVYAIEFLKECHKSLLYTVVRLADKSKCTKVFFLTQVYS